MTRRLVSRDIQKEVNIELLTQELRTGLGDVLVDVRPLDKGTRIVLQGPNPAEVNTAIQIVQAHDPAALTEAQKTFETIKTLILGTVGKRVNDLSTAERWALLAGLLYQNQAITPDMTVRAPHYWIARQETSDD
jgi:hypothetical protein